MNFNANGNDKQGVNSAVKVVIIGACGQGRVIADIVRASGDTVYGFLDDNRETDAFPGLEILGCAGDAAALFARDPDLRFIIGVGDNGVRRNVAGRLGALPYYTAVHPSAVIASSVTLGEGSAVMANAVIGTGSRVGRHCIINTCASVDHDNVLCDFVHVSPGAHTAGAVTLGSCVWLGAGSTVINNITVCPGCTVGAGAVVVSDITEAGTYVGVPARRLEPHR